MKNKANNEYISIIISIKYFKDNDLIILDINTQLILTRRF